MQLQGKKLIITGSAGGIGRAIAHACIQEGAQVLLVDRNETGLHESQRILGEHSKIHVDDLLDPESAPRIVNSVLSQYGALDGVVNNAALLTRSTIETTTPDLFDRVVNVNAKAPLLLIQAGLEYLAQSKGSVVNIGSINAHCGEEPLLAYSMSKGALMTMTRNLGNSLHMQYGIRVNQINPGWVLTENEYQIKIDDGLPEDWPNRIPHDVAPSGALITPETIAAAAVYWLSDRSRPISGTVIDMEQYPVIGRYPVKEVA